MSTLTPQNPAHAAGSSDPSIDRLPWVKVLAWLTGIIAAVEVIFLGMIATIVPPIAAGIALTVVGLVVLRRARRTGIVILGLTSLLLIIGFAPFAASHLAHPESAVDFTHAVVGTFGRLLAVIAAIGAWRKASPSGARRLAVAAIGLAGLTVAASSIAMLVSTGDAAEANDVPTIIADSQFAETISIASGETLYVDNTDVFRHTFTVVDTDIDVELPAAVGVRVPIDLPAGVYDVICDISGHEHMTATLEVE